MRIRVHRESAVLSVLLEVTRLAFCQWIVIKVLSEGRQDMNIATQISTADQLSGATRDPDGLLIGTFQTSEETYMYGLDSSL